MQFFIHEDIYTLSEKIVQFIRICEDFIHT